MDWQALQNVYETWEYESQGLSPAAAALISIAVAAVTYNPGASWITSLTSNTALQAALAAGATTLASQASISVINNGGDLSAVLNELGSSATLRSLATSMITAGLTVGVMGELIDQGVLNADVLSSTDFVARVQRAAVRASVSTAANVAINGGALDEAVVSFLQSVAVDAVGGELFEAIGDLGAGTLIEGISFEEGDFQKVILYAAAGCGLATATGGSCQAGAMAAGLQEGLANVAGMDVLAALSSTPQGQVQAASMIAALAVALTGGSAAEISTARAIAGLANTNNRQLHTIERRAMSAVLGEEIDDTIFDNADQLSEEDRLLVAYACARIHCADHLSPSDPRYLERLSLQSYGFEVYAAVATVSNTRGNEGVNEEYPRIYSMVTQAYVEALEAGWPGRNSITDVSFLSNANSGHQFGAFTYTGYDARLDIAAATGIDVFGQARIDNGVPSIPGGIIEQTQTMMRCAAFDAQACGSLWQSAQATLAAVRALPEFPEYMEDLDRSTQMFIDGEISRETFVVVLADSGRVAGTADQLLLGLVTASAGGATVLNLNQRFLARSERDISGNDEAWRIAFDDEAPQPYTAANDNDFFEVTPQGYINQQKINDVIAEMETMSGPNITSNHILNAEEALELGLQWLGEGYKEIGSNGVYRSADNTRQFRIDNNSLEGNHNPGVPHIHIQTVSSDGRHLAKTHHIPFQD